MKKSFLITNAHGLHARPAANFVRMTSSIPAHITIECEGEKTDAKSIMGLIALRIVKNQVVTIEIDQENPSYMEKIETHLVENQIGKSN